MNYDSTKCHALPLHRILEFLRLQNTSPLGSPILPLYTTELTCFEAWQLEVHLNNILIFAHIMILFLFRFYQICHLF